MGVDFDVHFMWGVALTDEEKMSEYSDYFDENYEELESITLQDGMSGKYIVIGYHIASFNEYDIQGIIEVDSIFTKKDRQKILSLLKKYAPSTYEYMKNKDFKYLVIPHFS